MIENYDPSDTMNPEIEAQEITRLEFARMWGINGVVPDSVKTMLLIAYL